MLSRRNSVNFVIEVIVSELFLFIENTIFWFDVKRLDFTRLFLVVRPPYLQLFAAWRSGGIRSTNIHFCTKVQSKNCR
jgi:hypothetical protein